MVAPGLVGSGLGFDGARMRRHLARLVSARTRPLMIIVSVGVRPERTMRRPLHGLVLAV